MRPEAVTESLQIQASSTDVSPVRNCRTNRKEECGLWSYDSAQHLSSPDVREHLEHLLTVFRPLKSRLEEIVPRPNLFVHLRSAPINRRLPRIEARHIASLAELGAALTVEVHDPR
jgi:hypothetical protein